MRDFAAAMGRIHDLFSRGAFWVGCWCLAMIVVIFSVEVVMRYFFNAPLRWASDTVALLLLSLVFLIIPWLTRENGHVAITMLPDSMSAESRQKLLRLIQLISAITCFLAGYILLKDTAKVFERGLLTQATVPVPRWPFAALITYGLINSGVYFLRLTFAPKPQD